MVNKILNISLVTNMIKKLNLPLFSFFPEMNPCRIDLDETERRSFLMKDKQFLEKYNETLGKVSDTVNKI